VSHTLLTADTAPTPGARTRKLLVGGQHFAAKDILRAAGLPLLGPDDSEVTADLDKVKAGRKLSPVLLVHGVPLWVADGYHRVCASCHLDEKTPVPCRMVAHTPKG
jgi:hypothetical protein